MAMPAYYQRYAEIATALGFTLDIHPKPGTPHDTFVIGYPPAKAEVALVDDDGRRLLEFLNACHFASASAELEKRVAALEKAILQPHPSASITVTEPPTELADVSQKLVELEARAAAIGNLVRYEDDRYIYRRARRKSPKTNQPIFRASNVYARNRQHNDVRWFFHVDELQELEQAIAHDEAIYREHYTD